MDDGEQRRRRVRANRATRDPDAPPQAPPEPPGAPPVDVGDRAGPTGPRTGRAAEPRAARPGEPRRAVQRPKSTEPDGERQGGAEQYDLHPALGLADDRDSERGLRGLVGGGASQVGVVAAMRARDASRPTDADLAAAEANLTIVHRGWVPRDT